MILLIIGISLRYYASQPQEPKRLMCHKNRLLALLDGEGAVYTRIKNITCEYNNGMLVIEEQL
jgi:hypothetical protein